MAKQYKGSCLCGKVTFFVGGFSKQAAHCHCSMCRKFHGAAFGTLVSVDGLQWLSGEDSLKHFVAKNETIRTFCQHCGSSLGFRSKGMTLEKMELAIATFDENVPITIDAQIYTGNKVNWCKLEGDIPAFIDGRC